jgi:hypothetical protein
LGGSGTSRQWLACQQRLDLRAGRQARLSTESRHGDCTGGRSKSHALCNRSPFDERDGKSGPEGIASPSGIDHLATRDGHSLLLDQSSIRTKQEGAVRTEGHKDVGRPACLQALGGGDDLRTAARGH